MFVFVIVLHLYVYVVLSHGRTIDSISSGGYTIYGRMAMLNVLNLKKQPISQSIIIKLTEM